jgi:cysteine sulfinate desulfinase/cysteine desulfurase-like protein
MGRSTREALGTVRISMGRHTDAQRVDDLLHALVSAVERERSSRSE